MWCRKIRILRLFFFFSCLIYNLLWKFNIADFSYVIFKYRLVAWLVAIALQKQWRNPRLWKFFFFIKGNMIFKIIGRNKSPACSFAGCQTSCFWRLSQQVAGQIPWGCLQAFLSSTCSSEVVPYVQHSFRQKGLFCKWCMFLCSG